MKACFWWLWWVIKNNWLCAFGYFGVAWQEWLGPVDSYWASLFLLIYYWFHLCKGLKQYCCTFSHYPSLILLVPLLQFGLKKSGRKDELGRTEWRVGAGSGELNGPLLFKSIVKGSGYILKSIIHSFRNLFSDKDINQ